MQMRPPMRRGKITVSLDGTLGPTEPCFVTVTKSVVDASPICQTQSGAKAGRLSAV